MAQLPTPSTPDQTARRSFTAPIRGTNSSAFNGAKSPADPGSAEGIEVLYTHSNAKVFKFQTSASSSSPARPQSSLGTLPWATPAERTIASGPLEIYHVRGSMTMLHSGALLHPLLPRSQCWCVDGVSKFVIRASIDTYYRIELPGTTGEDMEKVELLKATLQKRIFYERTPCPFARTFTVDLPEEQPEPRKKRRRNTGGPTKKWKLDHAYGWRPEGWQPGMAEPEEEGEEEGSGSASTSGSESSSQEEESSPMAQEQKDTPSMRARAIQALRSASMPQQSTSPLRNRPMRTRSKLEMDGTVDAEESTAGAEREADAPILREFQSIPTDMPPSPPDSSAGLDYSEPHAKAEGWVGSEQTIETYLPEEHAVEVRREVEPTKSTDSPHSLKHETGEGHKDSQPDIELLGDREERSTDPKDGLENSGEDAEDIDDSVHTVIIHSPVIEPEWPGDDAGEDESLLYQTDPDAVTFPATSQLEDARTALEEPTEEEHTPEAMPAENEESSALGNAPAITHRTTATEDEHDASLSEDGRGVQNPESDLDHPATPPPPRRNNSDDPYAAIQARILARRSLSGTTSFHPLHRSPPRSSSSSNSSAATIISNRASRSSHPHDDKEDLATTLLRRVYSVFLGPPAHLVALMLKIAARFASGAFGVDGMFHVESPKGSLHRPPGSYMLQTDGEQVEAVEMDSEDDLDGWEENEDDFGVKLNNPPASDLGGLRERRGFEID